MTTKHTPGPWYVSGANQIGNPHRPYDIVAGMSLIATASVLTGSQHAIGEGQANARLIAAAPELLAALQEIVPAYLRALAEASRSDSEPYGESPVGLMLRRARAAIAKATGED